MRTRTVRNWPASAAGTAAPDGSANTTEEIVLLSGWIAVTRSGRKPGHAGGGAVATSPGLPAPAPSGASSIVRNDACQPGLSAGIRSARSMSARA